MAGAQPLAERLGLRVEPGLRRDALAEQPLDDEVDRTQIGQRVPANGEIRGFRQQPLELPDGQVVREPAPRLVRAHPHPEVGVTTFVAAARAHEFPQRHVAGRPVRQRLR